MKDRISRERIKGLERLMEARFEGADKATRLALDEREKAALKSERDYNERFKGQNEFRGTLSDQARTLMPRAESEKTAETAQEAMRRLENSLIAMAGRGQGVGATVAIALAVLGGVVGLGGLIVAILSQGGH